MEDITALLVRYCELMDAADWEAVGELFREGVLADSEGKVFARGADAVAAFYRNSVRTHDGSPRTKHLVLGTVIDERDDDSVTARSSYLVLQATDDTTLVPIATGRYVDRFVRSGEVWTFLERRFFLDLTGDLSHHLRFDP